MVLMILMILENSLLIYSPHSGGMCISDRDLQIQSQDVTHLKFFIKNLGTNVLELRGDFLGASQAMG